MKSRETHQILKHVAEEDSESGENPSGDAKKQNSLPSSFVAPEMANEADAL